LVILSTTSKVIHDNLLAENSILCEYRSKPRDMYAQAHELFLL